MASPVYQKYRYVKEIRSTKRSKRKIKGEECKYCLANVEQRQKHTFEHEGEQERERDRRVTFDRNGGQQ